MEARSQEPSGMTAADGRRCRSSRRVFPEDENGISAVNKKNRSESSGSTLLSMSTVFKLESLLPMKHQSSRQNIKTH